MVRYKNRFLLIELTWKDGKIDDSITDSLVSQALRDSLALNFGDHGLGSSLASLQVKYYSPYTDTAVVRCATAEHDKVATSLAVTTEIKQRRVTVRLVRLAGTLERCKDAALRHSAQRLARVGLTKQQRALAEQLHEQLPKLEL